MKGCKSGMYPFYCEAGAYARIQKQGMYHIAVACNGYLPPGRENQLTLGGKDELDWTKDWGYSFEMQGYPPMTALVKEFVEKQKKDTKCINLEDTSSQTLGTMKPIPNSE